MNRLTRIHRNYSQHIFLISGLALCLYFSYHSIYGDRSFEKLKALEISAAAKKSEYNDVHQQLITLENDVKRMRPNTLSLDFLEERARIVLGYKKPDEYILLGH